MARLYRLLDIVATAYLVAFGSAAAVGAELLPQPWGTLVFAALGGAAALWILR